MWMVCRDGRKCGIRHNGNPACFLFSLLSPGLTDSWPLPEKIHAGCVTASSSSPSAAAAAAASDEEDKWTRAEWGFFFFFFALSLSPWCTAALSPLMNPPRRCPSDVTDVRANRSVSGDPSSRSQLLYGFTRLGVGNCGCSRTYKSVRAPRSAPHRRRPSGRGRQRAGGGRRCHARPPTVLYACAHAGGLKAHCPAECCCYDIFPHWCYWKQKWHNKSGVHIKTLPSWDLHRHKQNTHTHTMLPFVIYS